MGEWLKKYGESIYATQGGPYKPGPWGVSTHKGDKVYLHVMQDLTDGTLSLPNLPAKITSASLLTGGDVSFTQSDVEVKFKLSGNDTKAINTVIVLDLEQKLPELTAIDTAPEHSLSHGAKATASSENNAKFAVGNLVGAGNSHFKAGAHHKSTWTHKSNDKQPWVEIDLGSEKEISQIQITEYKSQCRKFVLSAKTEHGDYEVIHEGDYLEEFSKKFKPFKASSLKLEILKREHGTVQVKAFNIY